MNNKIKLIVKITWVTTGNYIYYAHYKTGTVRKYETNDNLPNTVLNIILNSDCVKIEYMANRLVKREVFYTK